MIWSKLTRRREGADFAFTADRRLIGAKYGSMYAKQNPFPEDRFGGDGFDRLRNVDLEKVAGPRVMAG